MFDFEKLHVYNYSKALNKEILLFLKNTKSIDPFLKDQLKRAMISIPLNIAEGSGRFTKPDRKNFYTIARGSCYECVSLLQILHDQSSLTTEQYTQLYQKFEEISKMIMGMIKSQC
jgi:four helix bundle protein